MPTKIESDQANPDQTSEKQFSIKKIYLKDVSLEQPNTPEIFEVSANPELSVDLGLTSKQVSTCVHEVSLIITLSAKVQDRTLYILELTQAGLFELIGFETSQIETILLSTCPTILHPYMRSAVNDLLMKAGFGQVPVPEINYSELKPQGTENKV